MNHCFSAAKAVALLAALVLCLTLSAQPSGRSGFNEGWTFTLEGEAPRQVDLPHDWGVEKEFDLSYPSASGKLPWWGRAVYRKTLPVTPEDLEGRLFLEIDGAMAFASVRCNGEDLGGWPYGYASWRVELTPALRAGDNVLEVRIDNKEESSRWYPGGGLYRNVWITRCPKTGIAHWGTSVAVDVSAPIRPGCGSGLPSVPRKAPVRAAWRRRFTRPDASSLLPPGGSRPSATAWKSCKRS